MIQFPHLSNGENSQHVFDKDAARTVVSDVAQEIDPVVEKRVVRKIDWYFMPAMLIGRSQFDMSWRSKSSTFTF